MDDLAQAIIILFNPSIAPAVKERAIHFCDSIKQRLDCWRLCWESFQQHESLEVQFWCLQTIPQVVPGLPPDARQELRLRVLTWFRELPARQQQHVMLLNKIALIYVALLTVDYPSHWPTGWTDIMALLEQGPRLVDMFLRILVIFDQEVISDDVARSVGERQRSQNIKHSMRENDVMRLAECWYVILGTFKQSAPDLVMQCLKAISLYIVWVEITAVANDRFLASICGLIAEAGPCAVEACDCLAAVISKKMPAVKKVEMFEKLQILTRLQTCLHKDSPNLQLLEKEAELFNVVGEVCLDAYVDLRAQTDPESALFAQAAWTSVERVIDFIFWFFSHNEYQIAGSVEPFLTQFFVKVKTFVTGDADSFLEPRPCHMVSTEQVRPILMKTLQLIIQRIAFPDWFQHNDPRFEDDDKHVAFAEFRRSLTKIYKRIFLVDETLGFQFVQASIVQLTTELAKVRPMEVDAVLYLYKEAGETVKDVAQHLQASGALAGCFVQILDCEALVKSEHWAVQLALLEIYVRYGKIFSLHKELFPRYGQRVLEALCGGQGIRSRSSCVVARACFMFARFAKLAKNQVAPFTEQIHIALQDLLVVPYIPSSLVPVQSDGSVPKVVLRGGLKAEDQACLYEALATLVVSLMPEHMRPALQMLLKGPASNLSDILAAQPSRLAADPQGYASWAARSIEVVATVSKAFSVQHTCVLQDWEDVLTVMARILEKLMGHSKEASMWKASLFLCRRMVEVLSDRFLVPLDALLPFLYDAVSDQTQFTELSIFAHHIICQFQAKTEPLLQKWLGIIFLRPYELWLVLPEGSDQLKREKLELGSALLQLLKEAATRCPETLLGPLLGGTRPGPELGNFLVLGLQNPQELRALQLAASAWGALLEAVSASPAHQVAMSSLPLDQMLQRLLWSCMRMDLQDVLAQKVLQEVAFVLRSLTALPMPEAAQQQRMELIQRALLGAMPGLRDSSSAVQLCQSLAKALPAKDVKAMLSQCVLDWRRDTS